MKKILTLVLAAAMCLPVLTACKNDAATKDPAAATPAVTGKEALNGKKVIFFGNSHMYYGQCVIDAGQSTNIQDRENDQGIFYQLCKANGVEVQVTNFAFGVHELKDFYSGSCAAGRGHDGHDHRKDIVDYNYDYVILQQGTKEADNDLVGDVKKMMELFTSANPNVKFVFLVHQLAHSNNYGWLPKVKELEAIGVTVVDWGGLTHDIATGTAQVPGSTQTYDKNSFVISRTANDGYHPNILSGYITAMMTYCAITGEKAETLTSPDAACIVNNSVALQVYRGTYYVYDKNTNFDEVLLSETEMLGIRKLIDQYMAK